MVKPGHMSIGKYQTVIIISDARCIVVKRGFLEFYIFYNNRSFTGAVLGMDINEQPR